MKILYDNFASEIFNLKIGNIAEVESASNLYNIIKNAKKEAYQCLIVKIKTSNNALRELLQKNGFAEVNTQITYSLCTELYSNILSLKSNLIFREAKESDKQHIANIAQYSFKLDQFHADTNFDFARSDLFYKRWAINSCEGYADKVFVMVDRENADKVCAFVTLHLNCEESIRVGLAAVSEEERNKGIFTGLIINTLNWCNKNKIRFLIYGTQGKNVPILKTMEKLQGNIVDEDCVMHLFIK